MKKFFKALALVLALALVIGVVPAQATSAKIKAKKTLYVDGAKGTSTDGKLTSGYKSRVAIYKLAGDKKSVAADHTYKAVIKSGDSVTKTKKYVYAADLGKSVVEIFKDGESLGTSVITVKKNATDDTLTVTGFEDGQEVVCGVKTTVTLPRKGVDSDERRLYVDGELQTEVEGQARVYEVTFKKAGEHKVKFEAFQSAELDKATATKEITVKAVMPKPVSAKQVSASSFSVEFEGSMEGLITDKDIANEMIYYLIANQPVVTGVVKSVKVEDKVVTITMYSNFNSDTDYYFAYGSADAIKFHTAKNDIKYATELRLVKADAYYVGAETPVAYKFYNADGVELDIEGQTPSLTYDSDVAYLIGEKIYFFKEGEATIKASIITGYEEDSNTPIKLEATLTVTGVNKTATQTGKVYSFGAAADKGIATVRINGGEKNLQVKYKLSDGNYQTLITNDPTSNTEGYILRSADERIAMIGTGKTVVYGVSEGSTYIILCDKNGKELDVFAITVLPQNKVSAATTIELSQDTLNLNGGVGDSIDVVIQGIDLDNQKNPGYTFEIVQATNNADAVKVTLKDASKIAAGTACYNTGAVAPATNGKSVVTFTSADFTDGRGTGNYGGVAVVRLTVTVKTADAAATTVATKTVSFAVSNQSTADSWILAADKAQLDASIKDWDSTSPATEVSTISAEAVKMVSGYPFYIATDSFYVVSSMNNIPTTGVGAANYVVRSYPTGYKAATITEPVANATGTAITVKAFSGASEQSVTGQYTFTGYHVAFDATTNKGARTAMGTVNVVISKNDVAPTASIIKGTAAEFATNVAGKGNYSDSFKEIFAVSWAGKTAKDDPTRVKIKSVDATYDTTTGAYYCRSITVTLVLDAGLGYSFDKTISIGQLFKDK